MCKAQSDQNRSVIHTHAVSAGIRDLHYSESWPADQDIFGVLSPHLVHELSSSLPALNSKQYSSICQYSTRKPSCC